MQEQNTSAATSSSTRGAEHVRLQTHCDLHLHPQQMQELELERDVELEQAYRKQQEHQEQEQEGRQVSEQRRIQMYVAGQWYLLEAHPIPACEDTNSDANPLSCVGSQVRKFCNL